MKVGVGARLQHHLVQCKRRWIVGEEGAILEDHPAPAVISRPFRSSPADTDTNTSAPAALAVHCVCSRGGTAHRG